LARLDGDEAVTGIMARRILDGDHLAFFAGQAYQGSGEQYLQALVLRLLPDTPFNLRLVQVALAVLACGGVYLLGRLVRRSDRRALLAAALFAVGPYFSVLWSVKSRGAYDTGLLAGVGGLLAALWVRPDDRRLALKVFLFGLACGLGFWANWQAAYLLLPAAWWLLGTARGRWLVTVPAAAAGFVIGAAPSLGHLFLTGPIEASGPAQPSSMAQRADGLLHTTVPSFVGAQEAGVTLHDWIPPAVVTMIAIAALGAALYHRRSGLWDLFRLRPGRRRPADLLLAVTLTAPVLLVASRSSAGGAFPGYVFPLYAVVPVLFAALAPAAGRRRWGPVAVAGAMVVALALQSGLMARRLFDHSPVGYTGGPVPTETFPAVAEALRTAGVRVAYADYWIAFPLQFLVGDRLVVSPIRNQRFPALAARARAEPFPAFIVPVGPQADIVRAASAAAGSTTTERHVEGLALFTGRLPGAVLEGLRPTP
ncbi:MAG: glycosyltransferase family 39 protein, partial [Acidimicrobiia bacterium]